MSGTKQRIIHHYRDGLQAGKETEHKAKGPKPKAYNFVEIKLPSDKTETIRELEDETIRQWKLTLTRADGSRLEITPPNTRMQALVGGFLGGNDAENRTANADLCSH